MTTHVPVAIGGSTRGLSVRVQRAEIGKLERLRSRRPLTDAETARLGVLRERERIRTLRRGAKSKKREPAAAQAAELAMLEAASLTRRLTAEESVRLEILIAREASAARRRPARIAHLRRELERLEADERAAEQRALSQQLQLPLLRSAS